ncbi:porin family protein [Elizabethkingia anophelis]|uniref:Outer membrane protein W n=1 Tax=Elizabethkingia anophelis TaxID=1117645 RepID=A0A7Z7LYF6_9FLAO|nr:OmpW family outer membrane protein [Elizabethkingia anophelis]MCT3628694.1 porin family protein [Elizabethkingia anophelis]MCT3632368.1 porin family protein [Elizabethkingia anophelis]MCT3690682.1 porin family protein [Elizabethkingia anophelis]MCT3720188.1 porin family protein [Elizabethkingia anophelis]MCT3723698.1 porin family protein [Elizabethkingia anophelis]
MKKNLLIGAFALLGFAASAQTEKGSWVVGGSTSIGFNNVSTKVKSGNTTFDGPKVNTFTIAPSAGYFVIDKLSVGLDLAYTNATTKYDGAKTTSNTFAILPTATYYFTDNTVIKPYLGAGIGYASNTEKEEYRGKSNEYTVDGFAWKVKGGFAYFFTSSIAADLGLSYSQFSNKDNGVRTNVNTFGVGVGLSVFFK